MRRLARRVVGRLIPGAAMPAALAIGFGSTAVAQEVQGRSAIIQIDEKAAETKAADRALAQAVAEYGQALPELLRGLRSARDACAQDPSPANRAGLTKVIGKTLQRVDAGNAAVHDATLAAADVIGGLRGTVASLSEDLRNEIHDGEDEIRDEEQRTAALRLKLNKVAEQFRPLLDADDAPLPPDLAAAVVSIAQAVEASERLQRMWAEFAANDAADLETLEDQQAALNQIECELHGLAARCLIRRAEVARWAKAFERDTTHDRAITAVHDTLTSLFGSIDQATRIADASLLDELPARRTMRPSLRSRTEEQSARELLRDYLTTPARNAKSPSSDDAAARSKPNKDRTP